MKTFLKAALGLLIGWMLAYAVTADAYTIRQVRSLNAAAAVVNGASFDGSTAAQMPPQGGGIQWNVIVNATGFNTGTAITFQIQVKMIDGTWVPIAPGNGLSGSAGTSFAVSPTGITNGSTTGQAFSFFGPFSDMRVSVLTYTGPGAITADIYVSY